MGTFSRITPKPPPDSCLTVPEEDRRQNPMQARSYLHPVLLAESARITRIAAQDHSRKIIERRRVGADVYRMETALP